ncbi:MAG: 5-formyltetrahydrofolate cyclo-ligase [Bacteroidetes bacterium]|nr:5-formyltetrahydrofolate cyclo-ligase [Bacteroidota bacterium]MBS1541410.1 5-formyltetrahydrofolate cyclo-ligase [Bacteroidota bacterium]
MTKQEARSIYLKKRLALSKEEIERGSLQLCDRLCQSFDLKPATVIHTFFPIASKNEPDTWRIIEKLQTDFPAVLISIPKMDGDRLVNYYFKNRQQLALNPWGIAEPASGEITPPQKIDIVIVPLLAFDESGHRVGYGKGFYDRFLQTCRKDCKRIGLSFFPPVAIIDDTTPTDIRLTHCLTPEKIYTF